MTTIREARCSCGGLRATARGEPVRISICHCASCQRRTGSVFGAQARWPEDAVTLEGERREYTRAGDSGRSITFDFCPNCGGTVRYRIEAAPGVVAIPVGCFADPTFPPPRVTVYDDCRHPWVALPESIERNEDSRAFAPK